MDEFEDSSEEKRSVDDKIRVVCSEGEAFWQDYPKADRGDSEFRSLFVWIELLWDRVGGGHSDFVEEDVGVKPGEEDISDRNNIIFDWGHE